MGLSVKQGLIDNHIRKQHENFVNLVFVLGDTDNDIGQI